MINLDHVTVERLPELQRDIAKLISLENFAKLVENFGGIQFYIPKVDSFLKESRNAEIVAEFDGHNYYKLAMKYGLSELSIRLIVAEKDKRMKASQVEGQLPLAAGE